MSSIRRFAAILAALAAVILGFGGSPSLARPGTMLFSDGFESGNFNGWDWVQPGCGVGGSNPYATVLGSPVRTGAKSAQIVNRGETNPWGTEACEISDPHHTPNLDGYHATPASYHLGQDDYYGVSYRFPSPYTPPINFGVIGQFAYPVLGSPPVSVVLGNAWYSRNGGPCLDGDLCLQINGGRIDPATHAFEYSNWPGDVITHPLVTDQWYDIIIHVHEATDTTGMVEVWVRRDDQADFTRVVTRTGIPTVQWKPGVLDRNGNCLSGCPLEAPYDKIGVYREPRQTQPPTTVQYDNLSYGTSYDVVRATFPHAAPLRRRQAPLQRRSGVLRRRATR
jgi:hypothetical protein